LRGGLETVSGEHDTGFDQLLIEFAHRLEQRGRLGVELMPISPVALAWPWSDERGFGDRHRPADFF
jgi:hypothetical protein